MTEPDTAAEEEAKKAKANELGLAEDWDAEEGDDWEAMGPVDVQIKNLEDQEIKPTIQPKTVKVKQRTIADEI